MCVCVLAGSRVHVFRHHVAHEAAEQRVIDPVGDAFKLTPGVSDLQDLKDIKQHVKVRFFHLHKSTFHFLLACCH